MAATHLVGHQSHLRLLALSSLPVSLGRSLGLISTGHDYWAKGESCALLNKDMEQIKTIAVVS